MTASTSGDAPLGSTPSEGEGESEAEEEVGDGERVGVQHTPIACSSCSACISLIIDTRVAVRWVAALASDSGRSPAEARKKAEKKKGA
jgi:hypothetical protein